MAKIGSKEKTDKFILGQKRHISRLCNWSKKKKVMKSLSLESELVKQISLRAVKSRTSFSWFVNSLLKYSLLAEKEGIKGSVMDRAIRGFFNQ